MLKDIILALSYAAIPLLIAIIVLHASAKKVPVYEVFTQGAKQGFVVGAKIIPYLVAMLVAVGMFRASGAIELMAEWFAPVLAAIGMPADLIPLAVVRSLSGSGALGILGEIATANGGNAYVTKLAAVMTGSSETTFYVLALYFGSVGVTKFRHALAAGIIADIIGIFVALFIGNLVFG